LSVIGSGPEHMQNAYWDMHILGIVLGMTGEASTWVLPIVTYGISYNLS